MGKKLRGLFTKQRIAIFILSGFWLTQTAAVFGMDFSKPPVDKAAHFGIAATAQTTCSLIGKAITKNKWASEITCFLAVNTAGVIKEATDPMRGGTRDVTDIYANLAGSGLSFLVISVSF